jgi:hypothetical protein
MKLDPGMHIVMHLVFFGKTDVTGVPPLPVIVLEESGAVPSPATAAVVEEGRTAVEMAAPKRHQSHQLGLARVVRTW